MLLLLPLLIGLAVSMTLLGANQTPEPLPGSEDKPAVAGGKTLVIGGGCFWCTESLYEMVKGVTSVEAGYAGGNRAGVTYEQVYSGMTGHAEVVRISYDPNVVSGDDLLRLFFTIHDPTTKDRQGGDVGTQYRSVIFYTTSDEKESAERIIKEIDSAKIWPDKIVTTVEPLKNYTRAEDYHQDYFRKYEKATEEERSHMNSGYCQAVIAPKVLKFREHYKKLLKGSG